MDRTRLASVHSPTSSECGTDRVYTGARSGKASPVRVVHSRTWSTAVHATTIRVRWLGGKGRGLECGGVASG